MHGNSHDGFTLAAAMTQAEINTDEFIIIVFADQVYRDHEYNEGAEVYSAGKCGVIEVNAIMADCTFNFR